VNDIDAHGEPLGETTTVTYEWAVKVEGLMNGVPGPHILATRADEGLARARLAWL